MLSATSTSLVVTNNNNGMNSSTATNIFTSASTTTVKSRRNNTATTMRARSQSRTPATTRTSAAGNNGKLTTSKSQFLFAPYSSSNNREDNSGNEVQIINRQEEYDASNSARPQQMHQQRQQQQQQQSATGSRNLALAVAYGVKSMLQNAIFFPKFFGNTGHSPQPVSSLSTLSDQKIACVKSAAGAALCEDKQRSAVQPGVRGSTAVKISTPKAAPAAAEPSLSTSTGRREILSRVVVLPSSPDDQISGDWGAGIEGEGSPDFLFCSPPLDPLSSSPSSNEDCSWFANSDSKSAGRKSTDTGLAHETDQKSAKCTPEFVLHNGGTTDLMRNKTYKVRHHHLAVVQLDTPSFCDVCRELVWGVYRMALQCNECHMTCHSLCRAHINFDCIAAAKKAVCPPPTTQANLPSPLRSPAACYSADSSSMKTSKLTKLTAAKAESVCRAEQLVPTSSVWIERYPVEPYNNIDHDFDDNSFSLYRRRRGDKPKSQLLRTVGGGHQFADDAFSTISSYDAATLTTLLSEHFSYDTLQHDKAWHKQQRDSGFDEDEPLPAAIASSTAADSQHENFADEPSLLSPSNSSLLLANLDETALLAKRNISAQHISALVERYNARLGGGGHGLIVQQKTGMPKDCDNLDEMLKSIDGTLKIVLNICRPVKCCSSSSSISATSAAENSSASASTGSNCINGPQKSSCQAQSMATTRRSATQKRQRKALDGLLLMRNCNSSSNFSTSKTSSSPAELAVASQIDTIYLPFDSTTNLHVTAHMTTRQVIRAFLQKYRIVDDQRKFSLFQRVQVSVPSRNSSSSKSEEFFFVWERVPDLDTPLWLALVHAEEFAREQRCFVLRESDNNNNNTRKNWDDFVFNAGEENILADRGQKDAAGEGSVFLTVPHSPAADVTEVKNAAARGEASEVASLAERGLVNVTTIKKNIASSNPAPFRHACRERNPPIKSPSYHIPWHLFSVHELNNFLLILDQEHRACEMQVRNKYLAAKKRLLLLHQPHFNSVQLGLKMRSKQSQSTRV